MTMTQPQISPMAWLNLDTQTRVKIAEAFGIPQKHPTHVSGGRVVDSGHDWADLVAINVGSMQKMLDSKETDFFKLWDALVERTKAVHPMVQNDDDAPLGVVIKVPKPKTKKRGTHKAK